MSKKNILALVSVGCLITTILIISVNIMIGQATKLDVNHTRPNTSEEIVQKNTSSETNPNLENKSTLITKDTVDLTKEEPWLAANPSDTVANNKPSPFIKENEGIQQADNLINNTEDALETSSGTVGATVTPEATENTIGETVVPELELIVDCNEIDYKAYIPTMVMDSKIEIALNINNPNIAIDAASAILLDAETKKVLYYKEPVQAVFPASTAKLLTALVGLEWCKEDEQVTVGDEVSMIASDSTRAYLKAGQILTIRNLLEGMLLPSGNDAAYVIATYVGRKSLKDEKATTEDAVLEFTRLMNEKAKALGAKNSCFKTPDGYDAIGQYTTAYDMGMVGLAALENNTIVEISNKSKSRNIFVSGEDITWYNTNALINPGSGRYYSKAIGLKTGTSTMAGRCIVAAAESNGKKILCVIMNSTSSGRWADAMELLQYGLK